MCQDSLYKKVYKSLVTVTLKVITLFYSEFFFRQFDFKVRFKRLSEYQSGRMCCGVKSRFSKRYGSCDFNPCAFHCPSRGISKFHSASKFVSIDDSLISLWSDISSSARISNVI